LIYVGGGAVLGEASHEVTELVRLLDFPCTNTLMGLGSFPASDRRFCRMLGMHGTVEATWPGRMRRAAAVGARFDDRVIGNPAHFAAGSASRKIVHNRRDRPSISKRVRVDVPIVGHVKDVLTELLALLKAAKEKPDAAALAAWWDQIGTWRAKDCLKYDKASKIIKPQFVIEKLWEITKGGAYVTSDVGLHQCGPRSSTVSSGRAADQIRRLGTKVVGLPMMPWRTPSLPEGRRRLRDGRGSIQIASRVSTCKQYICRDVLKPQHRYMGWVRMLEFFHGTAKRV